MSMNAPFPGDSPSSLLAIERLRLIGVEAESIWTIGADTPGLKNAIPEVLSLVVDGTLASRTRSRVAQILMLPPARKMLPEIVRLYKNESDREVKNSLGFAAARQLRRSERDLLVELLLDDSIGMSRIPLISAVPRVLGDDGMAVLRRIMADPELLQEAVRVHENMVRAQKKRTQAP